MTARVLHWITAFLILSMIPLGVVIANEWGGSAQGFMFSDSDSPARSWRICLFSFISLRSTHQAECPTLREKWGVALSRPQAT
jgi:hypothetical protein